MISRKKNSQSKKSPSAQLKSFFRRLTFAGMLMILISGVLVWKLAYFQILDTMFMVIDASLKNIVEF